MISADLRFEGFDSRSWTNLLSLFMPSVVERHDSPPEASDDPTLDRESAEREPRPTGSLVLIVDDHGALLKAIHTVRGRITDIASARPSDLPRLATAYRAQRVVLLREGVMDEVSERLAVRIARGDDYVTQWLALARILRELQEGGLIHIHPLPLEGVPIPSATMVRRALDVVLPDDHAMVVVLWERSQPWTSFALRRRAGDIDLMAGPDLIARWTGPLGGDFRRDYRVVVDAVSRSAAPVHLGVFAEARTMRTLLANPNPGAWARATAVRDVVLHPAPPYVAVAVGADAFHGVARRSAELLGGLDVLGQLTPISQYVRGRVHEIASVTSALGFNPLRALATVLARQQPPEQARPAESVAPPPMPDDDATV